MLQKLSLQQLEELQSKLAEIEKILNPDALDFTGLYKTSNHHALMIKHFDLEVTYEINKIYLERENK